MGDNVFHLSSCFYNPVVKMTEPLIFGKIKLFFGEFSLWCYGRKINVSYWKHWNYSYWNLVIVNMLSFNQNPWKGFEFFFFVNISHTTISLQGLIMWEALQTVSKMLSPARRDHYISLVVWSPLNCYLSKKSSPFSMNALTWP